MHEKNKETPQQDLDIYNLQDWFHVPEFAEAFKYKVWSQEAGDMKETIEAYQRQKETYHQQMYENELKRLKAAGEDEYPVLYWFELTMFKEGDWGATILYPSPPPSVPHYEILSDDVIAGIARTAVEMHSISTLVVDHAWKDVPLDRETVIRCVRISPTHIVGTLRDKLNQWETRLAVENGSPEQELDRALRVLLYQMHKNPGLDKAFIKRYAAESLT